MDTTRLIKGAAALVVGIGTAKVVKEIIRGNTAPENVTDKAAILIASYVLGAIAADAAVDWSEAKIDKLISWWTTNVTVQIRG